MKFHTRRSSSLIQYTTLFIAALFLFSAISEQDGRIALLALIAGIIFLLIAPSS